VTQLIKSKKIAYYDEQKKVRKIKKFSALENARINEIWARVGDILSEQNIKGKYIISGKRRCCSRHSSDTQISFVIETDPEISVESIVDIRDVLEELDVEFSTMTASKSSLNLVFVQNIRSY
jgi:hypothetical protein